MAIEIEEKIALSPDALEDVFQKMQFTNVIDKVYPRSYFDTSTLDLNAEKKTLRIQDNQDGTYLMTIKTKAASKDGAWVRYEWDIPVSGDRPDFSKIQDDDAKKAVAHLSEQSLQHIFTTHVRRRSVHLDVPGQGRVEIAFDLGEIKLAAGLAPEFIDVAEISEIEVELLDGDKKAIDVVVAQIREILGARELPAIGKARRGFDLYKRALK